VEKKHDFRGVHHRQKKRLLLIIGFQDVNGSILLIFDSRTKRRRRSSIKNQDPSKVEASTLRPITSPYPSSKIQQRYDTIKKRQITYSKALVQIIVTAK
jgi:hypothetical protein